MKLSKLLMAALAVVVLVGASATVQAANLATGTTLTITNGSGNSGVFSATVPGTGSAFSMLCCGPTPLWTDIPATAIGGTNGGLVVGVNQNSGGEQITTGTMGNGAIDNAWYFFNSYGTDYTNVGAGATANSFAAATCTSGMGTTACSDGAGGTTKLGTWQVAWNGLSVPMGGGKVSAWKVSGTLYTLNYKATVPAGDPSGFGGVPYGLHLEGSILAPPAVPEPASLLLLGTGLLITGTIARRFIKK